MTNAAITNEELTQYIEVWEEYNSQIKEIRDLLKEHKKNGKGKGYDNKVCGGIIKDRARNKEIVEEERAIREIYEAAIGEK